MINIAVDLDGVCCNFSKKFSEIARSIYGDRCYLLDDPNKIKEWDWTLWYPLTKNEVKGVWEEIHKTKDFWTTLEVLNKSQWEYFVNKINMHKEVDVYFITAREKTLGLSIAKQSAIWLDKNGWKYPFVIQTHKKEKIINELDIKLFIDDNAENLISAKNYNPDCLVYAQEVPHNIKKIEESGIKCKRVSGLMQFSDDIIDYISNEEYKIKWGKA